MALTISFVKEPIAGIMKVNTQFVLFYMLLIKLIGLYFNAIT